MNISGIYQIQSKCKQHRKYIGSAVGINKRWRLHLRDLRLNKHHSKKLQRHYNKYGEDDLVFSIILGCDKEDLLKHEQYFLEAYRPCFNTCLIAGSQLGTKRSEEYCKKASLIRKGRKNPHKGYVHSPETILKRSISMKGKNLGKKYPNRKSYIPTLEHRLNISKAHKGLHYPNKKPASDETREKMRIAKLGKKLPPFTEEHKRKISHSHLGKKHSLATRAQFSISRLGRKHSEETKRKMGIAQTLRYSKTKIAI